jgi:hypothetical protein
MLSTVPTGRIDGSAAAMPLRTPTPDAVVVPLQYAVALKGSRAPGNGDPSGLVIVSQAALRESRIWLSYINTNPTTAARSTVTLSQV